MNAARGSLVLAVVGFALAGLSGCGRRAEASVPVGEVEKASLSTVHPERRTLRTVVEQPGQIEGFEQTALVAKISGYVKVYHKDMGDRVKKGEVLAELRVPELEEELRQKSAYVEQAQAEVIQAKRALEAAEASVRKSEALVNTADAGKVRAEASLVRWRADFDRNRRLVATRVSTEEALEQSTDSFHSAEAALDEAKAMVRSAQATLAETIAQRAKSEADVTVAKAKVKVAEADRDHTAANLSYATIKAPYDGVITKRYVDTETFLPASTSGSPLFMFMRTDKVRIFLDVPEHSAARVTDGTEVFLHVPNLDGQEVSGKVTRSSWSLDVQSRTLHVQVDLDNRDGRLRPGMYVTARLAVDHSNVLTLPTSAILSQDDQNFVIRVENGKALRTPICIGLRQGDRVQVLKKATAPARRGEPLTWENWTGSEEVASANPAAFSDGQAVTVKAVGSDRVAQAD